VLQCVAVCCSVLQCVAYDSFIHVISFVCMRQVAHCVAVVEVRCSALQCVAVCCT